MIVPFVHSLRIGFYRRFAGESAAGQMMVENLATLIQACPQGRMGWVGLSQQRLSCHRLMGALNDGVIGGTALAGEAHLHSQRE
jgi:hypothetical protein